MSEQQNNGDEQQPIDAQGRPVGDTEYSWCKAVPGGTGITVLALLFSKPPDFSLLQNSLHRIQITHPIIRSNLHFNPTTNTFSYTTPSTPHLQIQPFDLQSTAQILQTLTNPNNSTTVSPFHLILEHELNRNTWSTNPDNAETETEPDTKTETDTETETDVFNASVYTLSDGKWVVALRLHTSVCDRTTAASMLGELLVLMGRIGIGKEEEGTERELENGSEVSLGMEDYIPRDKANKPFWARGVDMLGYSLNSLRFANLKFEDAQSPRSSQVVRLQLNSDHTHRIISGCESRGVKLCSALAAAGLIAAHSSKCIPDDQWEKYAVVTLIDCRSILDPALSNHHYGFYHSAILNTHDIKGGEKLWELTKRTHLSFENAKNNNKHFSDRADLNFLMCKAIDNPGLTPSSSLRTSFLSVFEDPVIDRSDELHRVIGVEDYIGCASVHGVGPSMAIFDTIRKGQLDCACVYPSPLHSREQMEELVDEMKRALVEW